MCQQGTWDGIGTLRVYPDDMDGSIPVIVEQCTACGSYQSVDARNVPVATQSGQQAERDGGRPDESSEEGVW